MAEPGFDFRRILLVGGVVVVLLVSAALFFFRGCAPMIGQRTSPYTVIYSNLDLRDAANVIARLKEISVPYEIKEDGRAIAVPKNKADEVRLSLAEKNLPAGGVVGWEIFDVSRLGATDFDRRIQLIRAISGELSRTIRRIEGVDDCRVQIVIPETRLFAAESPPVTASVMLRLRPGVELTAGKINGIVHLVASSVENLRTENVTVIDDTGRILTAKALLSTQEAAIIKETVLPLRVSTAVAEKRPTAPVPAEVAPPALTSEVKKVQTKPSTTVEATVTKTATVTAVPLSPEEKLMFKIKAKKEIESELGGKAQEIVNRFYPPNSVIVRVNIEQVPLSPKKKPGAKPTQDWKIKRLTTIILIDNRITLFKQLKDATFKAVAAATGYTKGRGDRIILQKVPFHLATPSPEVVRAEVSAAFPKKVAKAYTPGISISPTRYIKYVIAAIGTGSVILIVWLLIIFKKRRSIKQADFVQETPFSERRGTPQQPASTIESIRSMVEGDPERIAQLLKHWLTE